MALTKSQIEEDLRNSGDFVKIDHLNRFLRQADSLDVRKFILLKLAEINANKGFYPDAAKNIDAAADISLTYKEKMELYMREAELYVKIGHFEIADAILKKALIQGNAKEQAEIKSKYIQIYYKEAQEQEKALRNRKAVEYYERIYYNILGNDEEKAKMKDKLLDLYNKLGRVRDYSRLAAR
ncbi:hypothetical protein HYW74_01030 [Candidatus Pacearchaeota archaeon]|nr:hypothetical protein [Candidatus Pacearchaeota archaeon]